jgi:hypothetical protein
VTAALPVVIALFASAHPVSGTGDCPSPEAVGALLPELSSAVQVDVSGVRDRVRVQLLDREGRVLSQQTLSGEGCQELAQKAADQVRRWAEARGALRAADGLPPPPLLEIPEDEGRGAKGARGPEGVSAVALPPPAPGPVSLGVGAGVGIMGAPGGSSAAAILQLWLAGGPTSAPAWAEVGLVIDSGRRLFLDSTAISWNRNIYSVGAAWRPKIDAKLDLVGGLMGGLLQASTLSFAQPTHFSSFDIGLYAGGRLRFPIGPIDGWVGGMLNIWFVEHRIRVGDPSSEPLGGLPIADGWGAVGVSLGGGP